MYVSHQNSQADIRCQPHGRRFGTRLLFRVILLLKCPQQQLSQPDLRAGSPFRPKTKAAAIPLSLFRLTPSLGWQEITRGLFLFHNPWDCPVWTASLGLEGPPSPSWKATDLSHILTCLLAAVIQRAPPLLRGLCSAVCSRDTAGHQPLFAVTPLDVSGLGLPALLDPGSISDFARCPAHPAREQHLPVLAADPGLNLARWMQMLRAVLGCDKISVGGQGRGDSCPLGSAASPAQVPVLPCGRAWLCLDGWERLRSSYRGNLLFLFEHML